ncbi:hypothetical protein LXA43DRAFT_1069682 [Ganoderma leucocontextum]|nr:hypothetical protein LXA43DRAFT_1069682 [Ganoderma leucocontextum]
MRLSTVTGRSQNRGRREIRGTGSVYLQHYDNQVDTRSVYSDIGYGAGHISRLRSSFYTSGVVKRMRQCHNTAPYTSTDNEETIRPAVHRPTICSGSSSADVARVDADCTKEMEHARECSDNRCCHRLSVDAVEDTPPPRILLTNEYSVQFLMRPEQVDWEIEHGGHFAEHRFPGSGRWLDKLPPQRPAPQGPLPPPPIWQGAPPWRIREGPLRATPRLDTRPALLTVPDPHLAVRGPPYPARGPAGTMRSPPLIARPPPPTVAMHRLPPPPDTTWYYLPEGMTHNIDPLVPLARVLACERMVKKQQNDTGCCFQ